MDGIRHPDAPAVMPAFTDEGTAGWADDNVPMPPQAYNHIRAELKALLEALGGTEAPLDGAQIAAKVTALLANLSITQDLGCGRDLSVGRDLLVVGDAQMDTLLVHTSAEVGGTMTADSFVGTAGHDSSIGQDLSVGRDLLVAGEAQAASGLIHGALAVGGEVKFDSSAGGTGGGPYTINKPMGSGGVTVAGTFNTGDTQDVTFNNTLVTSTSIIHVTGYASAAGEIKAYLRSRGAGTFTVRLKNEGAALTDPALHAQFTVLNPS